MKTTAKARTDASLPMLLRSFKLPAFVREYANVARFSALHAFGPIPRVELKRRSGR